MCGEISASCTLAERGMVAACNCCGASLSNHAPYREKTELSVVLLDPVFVVGCGMQAHVVLINSMESSRRRGVPPLLHAFPWSRRSWQSRSRSVQTLPDAKTSTSMRRQGRPPLEQRHVVCELKLCDCDQGKEKPLPELWPLWLVNAFSERGSEILTVDS